MEYFDVSSVARGIILKRKKLLCVVNVDWFFLSHRLPVFAEAIKNNYEVHIATTITDKLTVLQNSGFIVHPLNIHRSRTGLFSVFFEFIQILSVIRTISPDIVAKRKQVVGQDDEVIILHIQSTSIPMVS